MQHDARKRLVGRSAARAVGLRASQRLVAQGVLGHCARLLRLAQQAQFAAVTAEMAELMRVRRRMLRELQVGIRTAAELSCVAAVSGAVAESDRGLLVMMNNSAQPQR